MIAFVPGRRRTARSIIKKWSLIAFAVAVSATALGAAAVLAYNARPEPEVIVVMPAAAPTATPIPYFPATGPDLSLPRAYSKPLEIPLGPHVQSTAQVHLGPDDLYVVLGTLQAGAPLDIVGRDESGEWLAIVFPPNSTLRAWLPVSQASGAFDVDDLPIEPVQPLP